MYLTNAGMATAARMPMMATTIISSTSVKPLEPFRTRFIRSSSGWWVMDLLLPLVLEAAGAGVDPDMARCAVGLELALPGVPVEVGVGARDIPEVVRRAGRPGNTGRAPWGAGNHHELKARRAVGSCAELRPLR